MDIYGIEALLGLPEFHVVNQVIRPKRLICISNDETAPSCVPTARPVARACSRVGLGAFVTCPSCSVRLCCGCIYGALCVRRAIIGPGREVKPSVLA
jgi:hypothetical protein